MPVLVTGLTDPQLLAYEETAEAAMLLALQTVADTVADQIAQIQIASAAPARQRWDGCPRGLHPSHEGPCPAGVQDSKPHIRGLELHGSNPSRNGGVAVLVAADPPPVPDIPGPPGQPYVSPDSLAAMGPLWNQQVQTTLMPVVAEVYQFSGSTVHAQLVDAARVPFLPPVSTIAAEQYLQQAAATFASVGNTLEANARASLLEGFQQGESIPELAARVRGSASMTAPTAVMYARTEVLDASNSGSFNTANASGLALRKGWASTPDPRTRPSHVQAGGTYGTDDQFIPLQDLFNVGGYACTRPHDPVLPPSERSRCRCTILYSVGAGAAAPIRRQLVPPLPGEAGEQAARNTARIAEIEAQGKADVARVFAEVEEEARRRGIPPVPPARIPTRRPRALPGPAAPGARGAARVVSLRPELSRPRTHAELADAMRGEMRRVTGREIVVEIPPDASMASMREFYEGVLVSAEQFPDTKLRAISWIHRAVEPHYAEASPDVLQVNSWWFSQARRPQLLASVRKDVANWDLPGANGWMPRNAGSVDSLGRHEYGHVVHMSLGADTKVVSSRALSIVQRHATRDGVTSDTYAAREMGAYATKDEMELVAGAFTDTMVNGRAAAQVSREIVDELERAYHKAGGTPGTVPSPVGLARAAEVPEGRNVTMSRADADDWAKDSEITFDLQHGTTPEAAEQIQRTGFDIGRQGTKTDLGNLGAGFYFNPAGAPSYGKAGGYGATLTARARVNRVMFTSSEDYTRARAVEDYIDILHSEGPAQARRYLDSNAVQSTVEDRFVFPAGTTNAEIVGRLTDEQVARYLALRQEGRSSGFVLRERAIDEGYGAIVLDMRGSVPGFYSRDGVTWLEVNVLRTDDIAIVASRTAQSVPRALAAPARSVAQLRKAVADAGQTIPTGLRETALRQYVADLESGLPPQAARQRAVVAIMDERRSVTAALTEAAELVANNASPRALAAVATRLRATLGVDAAKTARPLLEALDVGDADRIRAALPAVARTAKVKAVNGPGDIVPMDRTRMSTLAGDDVPAGGAVRVIRPGYETTFEGQTTLLSRAAVVRSDVPVPVKAAKTVGRQRESVFGGPMDPDEALLHPLTPAQVKAVADELGMQPPVAHTETLAGGTRRWPASKDARIRYLLQTLDAAARRDIRNGGRARIAAAVDRVTGRAGVTPRGLMTPAQHEARVNRATAGIAAERVPPVRVTVDASAGAETSRWRAATITGKPVPGAQAAVTNYLRQPAFMNHRLRMPDGPNRDPSASRTWLHEPSIDELLGRTPFDEVAEAAARAEADDMIRAMDGLMDQSRLPSDVLVWRGARTADIGVPDRAVGFEWTDEGFVSTAVRRGYAENDFATGQSNVLLRILAPDGTPALSLHGGEGELLLGRGLRYRVVADRGRTELGARLLDVEVIPTVAPVKATKAAVKKATKAAAPKPPTPPERMTAPALRAEVQSVLDTLPPDLRLDLTAVPKPTLASWASRARELSPDRWAEEASRWRLVVIERQRHVAELLAEADELIANGANASAMGVRGRGRLKRIEAALAGWPGEASARALVTAMSTGNQATIRRAIAAAQRKLALRQVGDQAGSVGRYDRASMSPISGTDIPDGAPVIVVRPGYEIEVGGQRVVVTRPVVQEATPGEMRVFAAQEARPGFDEAIAAARVGPEALDQAPVGFTRGRAYTGADSDKGLDRAFPDLAERKAVGEALLAYRGVLYKYVNQYLRGTLVGRGPVSNGHGVAEVAGLLRRVFDRSRLRGPVVTYRGVGTGESLFGRRAAWPDDLTGAEWTSRGVLSTSTSERTARKFATDTPNGGVLLRFLMPDGTPAIQLSGTDFESELLFPEGLRFRVIRDRPGRGAVARILDVQLLP